MDTDALRTVHTDPITLEASKQLVENYLDDYFTQRIAAADETDVSFGRLWRTIHELYTAGGKRLRPYVTLLSFQAYSPDTDLHRIIPAAAAQELLHIAMLIHDDIIDRDRIRYGVSNVAGQYDTIYDEQLPNTNERTHFADSAAILAGDLLLSDAYQLLSLCDVKPSLIIKAQHILNSAVFSVIGGELLDTEAAFSDKTLIRPLEIARLKTASYSFVSPLLMGATFAAATREEKHHLTRLGEAIGMAYQLQDDILGMFGDKLSTGKSVTGDLSEDKYTRLVQLFYQGASDEQKTAYAAIAGTPNVSDEQAYHARNVLIEAGAKAALEAEIDQLSTVARETLAALTIGTGYQAALNDLVLIAVQRNK